METIKDLLSKLNNKVTPSMAKRLDALQALQEKLEVAKEEYEAEPTDEKQAELKEIQEYIVDEMEDIVEDLKDLVRRKKFAEEAQASSRQATPKGDEKPEGEEKEEKEGLGMFGWIFGGALLVASFGAINYFRNNR